MAGAASWLAAAWVSGGQGTSRLRGRVGRACRQGAGCTEQRSVVWCGDGWMLVAACTNELCRVAADVSDCCCAVSLVNMKDSKPLTLTSLLNTDVLYRLMYKHSQQNIQTRNAKTPKNHCCC
jgi:hypothetical protein